MRLELPIIFCRLSLDKQSNVVGKCTRYRVARQNIRWAFHSLYKKCSRGL